jgi:hypothetical protein
MQKKVARENALAYFAFISDEKKRFKTLTPSNVTSC